MTSRPSVHHPFFARVYERLSRGAEEQGVAVHRDELLEGLSGRVVEVGAGNGMNFAHYPRVVTEVVAVEPEPYLRNAARNAARTSPVPVTVVDGVAERLPLEDASVDAGVASLVLCSVFDQGGALAELKRVIRPGGELRFYEHVHGDSPAFVVFQRVVDLIHPLLAGGCHVTRDTVAAIERAGFRIERLRPFRFTTSVLDLPSSPCVIGAARRA